VNVGFSLGITGTEVAKEASNIIIMDGWFHTVLPPRKSLVLGAGC
jgi:magnesium-transporting ATPase (P-type)